MKSSVAILQCLLSLELKQRCLVQPCKRQHHHCGLICEGPFLLWYRKWLLLPGLCLCICICCARQSSATCHVLQTAVMARCPCCHALLAVHLQHHFVNINSCHTSSCIYTCTKHACIALVRTQLWKRCSAGCLRCAGGYLEGMQQQHSAGLVHSGLIHSGLMHSGLMEAAAVHCSSGLPAAHVPAHRRPTSCTGSRRNPTAGLPV